MLRLRHRNPQLIGRTLGEITKQLFRGCEGGDMGTQKKFAGALTPIGGPDFKSASTPGIGRTVLECFGQGERDGEQE